MDKSLIGQILITEQRINNDQLNAALGYQQTWGKRLGECLVDLGLIEEIVLFRTLSEILDVPLVDISKIDPTKITKNLLGNISIEMAQKNRIVPIAIKEIGKLQKLVVAASDPTNEKIFYDIQKANSHPLFIMLAPDSDINWFIDKYYLCEAGKVDANYVSSVLRKDTGSLVETVTGSYWEETMSKIKSKTASPSKGGK